MIYKKIKIIYFLEEFYQKKKLILFNNKKEY